MNRRLLQGTFRELFSLLVTLARLNVNTLNPPSSLFKRPKRLPIARRRITERQRERMVELYEGGMDSQAVADELGVAKSTVLRTLKVRGVEVRPWGVKY